MKKINLKNLNLSNVEILTNLDLKEITGGNEHSATIVGSQNGFCTSSSECGYINSSGSFRTATCENYRCRYL